MVFRQLLYSVIDQIETTVSHIRKIHHLIHDRSCYDRCSHPLEMFVLRCLPDDLPVCRLNSIYKDSLDIFALAFLQLTLQYFHGILGSIVACLMSAHSVCHHKQIPKDTKWSSSFKNVILIHLSYHSDIRY